MVLLVADALGKVGQVPFGRMPANPPSLHAAAQLQHHIPRIKRAPVVRRTQAPRLALYTPAHSATADIACFPFVTLSKEAGIGRGD